MDETQVDVVAEMRDQAEWQETALDNPFMAKDMRGWADHMERLEAERAAILVLVEEWKTAAAEYRAQANWDGEDSSWAYCHGYDRSIEELLALLNPKILALLNPKTGDTL